MHSYPILLMSYQSPLASTELATRSSLLEEREASLWLAQYYLELSQPEEPTGSEAKTSSVPASYTSTPTTWQPLSCRYPYHCRLSSIPISHSPSYPRTNYPRKSCRSDTRHTGLRICTGAAPRNYLR